MHYCECLDGWSSGSWGVFIALNHQFNRWEGCCRWAHRTIRCATGRCPVRQPHHPTVRVLAVSTIGALSSCGTGQSGAAPDRYYALSGPPLTAALLCHALFALCSSGFQLLQTTVARSNRCSAGAPDSPVNYSGAVPEKPEGEEFRLYGSWYTGHCPVAHRTVRCARPGFSSVSFAPFF
jgi:hypothetical protein